jgi:hypothetical protein
MNDCLCVLNPKNQHDFLCDQLLLPVYFLTNKYLHGVNNY